MSNRESERPQAIVLYFGETVDYKYQQIMRHLPEVDYRPGTLKRIIPTLLRKPLRQNNMFVHVRYLFWRGYVMSTLIYATLIVLCKLKRCRLVWSCHNIQEHDIPSAKFNAFLRRMIAWASESIVVFHPALIKYLAPQEDKVIAANFGPFNEHLLDNRYAPNPEFLADYKHWLSSQGIEGPDIIFIGAYKPAKKIEWLIELAHKRPEWTIAIIAPRMKSLESLPTNLFLHNGPEVHGELDTILSVDGLIGYVAHDNLSVPSGFHLYAGYSIPMIGNDIEPIRSMITEWQCGELFSDPESLVSAVKKVKGHPEMERNALRASQSLSWKRSARAHAKAFRYQN